LISGRGIVAVGALVVQNAGPASAQGVVMTDSLPAGTSFVSATATAGTAASTKKGNGSAVNWNLPSLASNGSAALTLVVKVSAKAGSSLTNTASVSSSGPLDPNPSNNSASVTTSVLAKR